MIQIIGGRLKIKISYGHNFGMPDVVAFVHFFQGKFKIRFMRTVRVDV